MGFFIFGLCFFFFFPVQHSRPLQNLPFWGCQARGTGKAVSLPDRVGFVLKCRNALKKKKIPLLFQASGGGMAEPSPPLGKEKNSIKKLNIYIY